MPTAGDAGGPATRLDRFPTGPVWFSIGLVLILALFALPWTQARLTERGWPPETFFYRYAMVALIGATVGFAELVSRYRDEPWLAGRSSPGLIFIAANAMAAAAALWLLEYYKDVFNTPQDGVTRTLLAGFGAMVVLRSKLLTLRQPGGTEVEVGPAFVVDALLAAVNRNVDRGRAENRILKVAQLARSLARHDFAKVAPHLRASLLAFQNMDAEERKALNERIRSLIEDSLHKDLEDEVKFAIVGYDYLTAFGERAFARAFDEMLKSVPERTAKP